VQAVCAAYDFTVVVGTASTRLIVLRGNSGAGKSSVARALREACGGRGVAWVSQDLIRRLILRERDRPGAFNVGLIDQVTRYCLDGGYHTVLDGILYAGTYEPMLTGLARDHAGLSLFYYLDVSLPETIARHAQRPEAADFGADLLPGWYRPQDLLASVRQCVVPESSTLDETVARILADAALPSGPAIPGRPRQVPGCSSVSTAM
jgi:predicted kinase